MRRFLWLSLIFLISLAGCELQQKSQPSVLVVAVEGLSVESLSCDAEVASFEGIRAFCEESVRFSHAYAPSTMSQATMASLMTGLYPFDHGVHHNGGDFLSSKFRTLAEGALSKGYHTHFISGGAPIWRKSGLAQGFEVFDDTMDISLGNYYRPSEEVVKLAINWLEHEVAGGPFLSVLFFNDLQFPQITTRTRAGEVREKTSDAQLEEVAESLGILVKWLKSKRKWHSTNVVLVGLNSLASRENENEPVPLSLKSSSVQVSLFIKPARQERDNVIQWAVDKSVSLVDVGKTMFLWLGLEPPASSISELEPESLVTAVTQSAPNWKEDRLIVSETAWPDWLEHAGIRWAVRQNRFLYIHDQRPLIFNTLTDRLETLKLKLNDPVWTSMNSSILGLFERAKIPQWKGMPGRWPEQIEVAQELWRHNLAQRHPGGRETWAKWYLRHALVNQDWREVKRIAQESGDQLGSFVAARNLGENPPVPRNPCVRLVLGIISEKHSYQSECEDERLLALHAWQTAKTDEERNGAQDRFMRLYSLHLLDQQLGRLNFMNQIRWNVDRELPLAPQPLDYLLTMKELEPFAKKVSGLMSNKDLAF